jgi:hypothetical protein
MQCFYGKAKRKQAADLGAAIRMILNRISSDFIKCRKILGQLSNWNLINKDPAP